MRAILSGVIAAGLTWVPGTLSGANGEDADAGAEAAGIMGKAPENEWMKLPARPGPGYVWSSPVYAPVRGQILHWGSTHAQTGGPKGFLTGTSRNDILALDTGTGEWVSDYPTDEKAPVGIAGVTGSGGMLPSGRPKPAHVLHGGCYDSKRGQIVYTMNGLMAAYDPKTKEWKDLGARTVMPFPACDPMNPAGRRTEFAGGPPVYGTATCYDPVNDEILLFPHFDAKNTTLREATGQITGHYGTFRYRFTDNTWRMVGDSFGSDAVRKARKDLIAVMAAASKAMDAAWVLGRKPDAAKVAEAGKQLEAVKTGQGPVDGWIASAAVALAAGTPADAMKPLRAALWAMNESLDTTLRVEPPPRNGTPMVYDSKNRVIVLFGGHTNLARTDLPPKTPNVQSYETGLNDTWLYDCTTRQWRELPCQNRPPAGTCTSKSPLLAYDPESGLVVLVALIAGGKPPKEENRIEIWTLDAGRGEWSKRSEQPWSGAVPTVTTYGGSAYPGTSLPTSMLGFDPVKRLLVITQSGKTEQATYAMKLNLSKLPATPAPAWTPPPPVRPQEIPGDNAEWVAKLGTLPANTWIRAKPPAEPNERAWGNLSADAVRGWVVYFGGGHVTYQVNDVAVYVVGANAWVSAAADFNSNIPPQGWEGSTLGYRGGPACGHQRNAYQSFDGRLYLLLGTDERTGSASIGNPWNFIFHADRDFVRFYDIDRGGVWREDRIGRIERPEKVPYQTNVHLVDPDGRVINLIRSGSKMFAGIYDVNADAYTVREVPAPLPAVWELGESRPFCYLTGQGKVFYMAAKPDPDLPVTDPKKPPMKQVTHLYDTRENTFAELAPAHAPPAMPVQVVEYVESQKCAMAVIGNRQWVYSFEKNDWAELPMAAEDGKMAVTGPYGQLVWVARYGVFVNVSRGTWIMRPDFGQMNWGAAGPASNTGK